MYDQGTTATNLKCFTREVFALKIYTNVFLVIDSHRRVYILGVNRRE
jgi:hypothetical protein